MCRHLMTLLWVLNIFIRLPAIYGSSEDLKDGEKYFKDANSMAMLVFNQSLFYIWLEDPCSPINDDMRTSKNEKRYRPNCNLILHQEGCTNKNKRPVSSTEGVASWNGHLCPTKPAVGCSLVDRFTCTSYEILPVLQAVQLCLDRSKYIRNCSNSFGCNDDQQFGAYSVTKEMTACQPILYNQSIIYPYYSLPISQLDVNGWLPSFSNESVEDDSDYYVKTAAQNKMVFEALFSSVFDPYQILLKDFSPCLKGLLQHHQVVQLFLPDVGYLIEYGHSNQSFNKFAVCTIGGDDHRLYIRFILLNLTTCLSMFSLLVTIISMCVFKEHLNIPGVNLLNLCGCLMVTYITVMVANLVRHFGDHCLPESVVHVVSVLASVTWMNVMAFDIWHNLSRVYPMEASFSWRNRSKWLRYWAYGWLSPIIFCIIGCIADQWSIIPKRFKPHYTINCWFFEYNTYGTIIFYYGPIGIIMGVNLVFFVLTAKLLYYSQQHRQRYSVCGTPSTLRNLFQLYIKLFLIIGFTWILEVANVVAGNPDLIIASDFINSLQGFFLFLIFACKPKVFQAIFGCFFKRGASLKKQQQRQHSNSTTSRLSMSVLPSPPAVSINNHPFKKYYSESSSLGMRV
ncbi:hypothetical protein CHUAL_000906 [Chamberlinius hualienensis]